VISLPFPSCRALGYGHPSCTHAEEPVWDGYYLPLRLHPESLLVLWLPFRPKFATGSACLHCVIGCPVNYMVLSASVFRARGHSSCLHLVPSCSRLELKEKSLEIIRI
jgi:hypothetical protein